MRQVAPHEAAAPPGEPLVVRYSRRKVAPLAVVCYALTAAGLALLVTGEVAMLVGIGLVLLFGFFSFAGTQALLSDRPGLIVDSEGIRSPANGMTVPWSEVTAVVYEALPMNGSTSHSLHVGVRDGEAVLRRKPRDMWLTPGSRRALVRDGHFTVGLGDRAMPPEQIAEAVGRRFEHAARADSLSAFEDGFGWELHRSSTLPPEALERPEVKEEEGEEPPSSRQKWETYLGVGAEPRTDEERSVYRARRITTAGCILILAILTPLSVAQALGAPSPARAAALIVLLLGGVAAFVVRMWRL